MPKAYITIEDFKAGLDTRRLEVSAAPGSLQVFDNGHINRGGEIVTSKLWALKYLLPAGTFGLAAASTGLHVFGSTTAPANIPGDISYQRLRNPDDSPMVRIVDSQSFSGKIYAVAEFADGTIHHFYDGVIVSDWYIGKVRASHTDLEGFVTELLTDFSTEPGMTAAITAATTITLTGNTDNVSFDIIGTATDGGNFNDQTITITETQPAGATDPEITTVQIGGTFDPGDLFSVSIEDNIYGASPVTGAATSAIQILKNKMYAGADTDLFFSVVANPALWRNNTQGATANAGAGVINVSAQSSIDSPITGLGIYQNNLAVLMRNSAQIWNMSADPASSVLLQVLDNTGTRSPKTVKSFGDLDLFYLSESGVRSLRARDSSNSASVTDVGTPIDDILIAQMATMTDVQLRDTPGVIEPTDGRYIVQMPDKQYVFSYFSSSKISSWSAYAPAMTMSDFATNDGRLYGRASDIVYLLGGDDDDEYTDEDTTVELPYLDAGGIATWKRWLGVDIICQGVWDVYVNTNPNRPDAWVKTARITNTTIAKMNLAMQQNSPILKLKFVHQGDGNEARLSKIIIHYETKWAG